MRDGIVATGLTALLLLLLATVALAQTAKKPLSVGDIERLLKGGVTTARVATLVGRVGVDFEMTGATRARLERAGADAELIAAIERAAAARGAGKGTAAADGAGEARRAAAHRGAGADGARRADERLRR